ncbi:MAG: LptA/OstA family protein [Candidatus Gastranaerophilaceae bacterium]
MKKLIITLSLIIIAISTIAMASDLVIESKTQSYNEKENKIKFEDDVKVHLDDLHIVGDKADVSVTKNNQLDTATFYDKPYAYQVQNSKKREVKANILKLSLITKVIRAEGDTQSSIMEGNKPLVVITADTQEYDTKTNIMTAMGGVVIKYNDVETFSDKAVIKTTSKGDIQRLDLYGHAKVQEKVNNAEADHFSYDALKDEIYSEGNTMSHTELEGGVPLVVRARYQQYSKKQNIFNAGGNVRVWYDDYYAKGPKMTVYPDKATNKFNEIFFTGRSFINQGDRTIYADKIKMILKPKDFFAEGNTRTIIRNIQSESTEGKK